MQNAYVYKFNPSPCINAGNNGHSAALTVDHYCSTIVVEPISHSDRHNYWYFLSLGASRSLDRSRPICRSGRL